METINISLTITLRALINMTHKVKPIIHPMSLMTPKGGIITTTNQFPTFRSRKHKSQSKIKEIALLSNVEDTSVTTKNKQKTTYVT